MNIGIDIDNVISNFNEVLLSEYLIHDKELREKGIINKNAEYIRKGMFDWSEIEEENFYKENIERIARKLDLIEGAKEYINKLHEDGNTIYIITGRDNGEYLEPYTMTKKWLDSHNIYYDNLILTNAYNKHEKSEKCIENNIDVIIDDSVSICRDCINNGITTLLMDTPYNKYEKSIPKVYNWKEIFEYIIEYKKEKLNVILDTDTYNECDDQFALAYMIKNQDIFNIEAITVAPYSHKNRNETVISGREKSYNEILKICNWLDFNTTNKVFKGAEDYIHNGYEEYNDAVDKIIEVALKNNKTYIAIAIKKEPRIIDKIEVIWLGGNELGYKDNLEYNFRQDIEAIKIVFESKIKLTILPCENVVSALKININTLKERIGNKSKLCDYLIDRFYNDGYHGIQKERVIWDISVIAYMINRNWFKTTEVSCPEIKDDTSYEITENNHKITFVTELDRDKIYENLLEKL